MNTPRSERDPFDTLLDTYVEELMSLSDAQALDGTDPSIVQNEGLAMLEKSKVEAGKRRLASAKLRLARQKVDLSEAAKPAVSVQVARAFLRNASNNKRYTLAARGLDEMSDEDALRLYDQLKRLEGSKPDGSA